MSRYGRNVYVGPEGRVIYPDNPHYELRRRPRPSGGGGGLFGLFVLGCAAVAVACAVSESNRLGSPPALPALPAKDESKAEVIEEAKEV